MSRKNKIAVFILIVLTVASLALVVISTTSDRLNGAFRVLGTPVRSLQRAVTRLGDNISQRFSVMRENKAIKAEIDRLIEERLGVHTMTVHEPVTAAVVGTGKYAEVMAKFDSGRQ